MHAVIYDFHIPFVHVAEDGVAAVEVGLRSVGDKPLRAAGVFAGEGHADGAAAVF